MAHKKGVGSSKNGRESQSKEVLNSTRVKTSEWVKTTLFSL